MGEEGYLESPATRTFDKMCAFRIELPAHRAGSLMTVQECLDYPQALPFFRVTYR
jgi:hypothetical protein